MKYEDKNFKMERDRQDLNCEKDRRGQANAKTGKCPYRAERSPGSEYVARIKGKYRLPLLGD